MPILCVPLAGVRIQCLRRGDHLATIAVCHTPLLFALVPLEGVSGDSQLHSWPLILVARCTHAERPARR